MKISLPFISLLTILLSSALLVCSCTKQEELDFSIKDISTHDALKYVSDVIDIPVSHMNLTLMNATELGSYQDNPLVYSSIMNEGQVAIVAVDESSLSPNYVRIGSFNKTISGNEVDLIMVMSVDDELRSRMISYSANVDKKAKKGDGPIYKPQCVGGLCPSFIGGTGCPIGCEVDTEPNGPKIPFVMDF